MRRLALFSIPAALLTGMGAIAQAQSPTPADGIAKADFQAMLRTRMLKADTDGDGRISAAEWSTAAKARGKGAMADRAFARMDANRDGFIDAAELDALAAKRFDRQDANHDGKLSRDERKAMKAGRQENTGD